MKVLRLQYFSTREQKVTTCLKTLNKIRDRDTFGNILKMSTELHPSGKRRRGRQLRGLAGLLALLHADGAAAGAPGRDEGPCINDVRTHGKGDPGERGAVALKAEYRVFKSL